MSNPDYQTQAAAVVPLAHKAWKHLQGAVSVSIRQSIRNTAAFVRAVNRGR